MYFLFSLCLFLMDGRLWLVNCVLMPCCERWSIPESDAVLEWIEAREFCIEGCGWHHEILSQEPRFVYLGLVTVTDAASDCAFSTCK
jgi:hypothetical protein